MTQKIEWGNEWLEPVGFTIQSHSDFAAEKEKLVQMFTGVGLQHDSNPGENTIQIHLNHAEVENSHGIEGAYSLKIDEEIIITAASVTGPHSKSVGTCRIWALITSPLNTSRNI